MIFYNISTKITFGQIQIKALPKVDLDVSTY